jgi:hypothetical protein
LRANGSRERTPDDANPYQKEKWIASSHPPSPEGGLRRTGVLLAKTTGGQKACHIFCRRGLALCWRIFKGMAGWRIHIRSESIVWYWPRFSA